MNELRRRLGESLRVSGLIWTASLVIERILPVNLLGRWPQTRVPVERLRAQVLAILGAWGMPEVEAKTTADHLIYPDLCGIDSHGVAMLLHYQRALSDGSMGFQPPSRSSPRDRRRRFSMVAAGSGTCPRTER